MSRPWSEIEFIFETEDGRDVKVGLSTYTEGSPDEPSLGIDGDIMIQSLSSDSWYSLEESGLSRSDRARVESRVESELDRLTSEYSYDIGQSIAESVGDAWHDRMKDGD